MLYNFSDFVSRQLEMKTFKALFVGDYLHFRPITKIIDFIEENGVETKQFFVEKHIEKNKNLQNQNPVSEFTMHGILNLAIKKNDLLTFKLEIKNAEKENEALDKIKEMLEKENLISTNFNTPENKIKTEIKIKNPEEIISVGEGVALGKTFIFEEKINDKI
jgi:phosphotransferase system HPr-like phosphotransfer protein